MAALPQRHLHVDLNPQGYFQPDVGGKNIPVAAGELSDLAGDEPLFKALYKWCAAAQSVAFHVCPCRQCLT